MQQNIDKPFITNYITMKINDLHRLLYICTTFCFVLLLFGCAQETAPTGGPKDTKPPVAMHAKPANQQTLFAEKNISITFDEFVVLNDAPNQILISPPILPKPTFSTKGKSVVVNLKNSTLEPNTTYNIFFGDAIQDLHEGNTISNLHYVFSTGETIDSLCIIGKTIHAFDNSNAESVLVMLYTNNNDTIPFDSLPYRVLPHYIGRSDKNGDFKLNNLAAGEYKIFALKDENRNFIYDLPNEAIGFLQETIQPYYLAESHEHDSIPSADSTNFQTTDHPTDTTITEEYDHPLGVKFLMFNEIDSTVKLLENKVIDSVQARFFFSFATENTEFHLLNHEVSEGDTTWMFQEWNRSNDTLTAWFPTHISDTLEIEVVNNQMVLDTVSIALKTAPQPRRKAKEDDLPPKKPSLKIASNASGSFPFFQTMKLTVPTPLQQWNFDHALFVAKTDTIAPSIVYDNTKRTAFLQYTFKEQTSYELIIPENCCTDIIGLQNDTTKFAFKTDDSQKYGTLKIHLSKPDDVPQIVIQVMSEDLKKIVKELIINENTTIDFGYLSPQKVKIKAIFDTNQNGKWDAGNYLHNIQPERTYIYEKSIEIRAYWDAEETWKIEN